MLMNAHSTAVMTKLGRVIGNTMTNVRAGNLKLIGRATLLVLSHVNCCLDKGKRKINPPDTINTITKAEANAVLFETIDFLNS